MEIKLMLIGILMVGAVIVAAFGWKAFREEDAKWHGKLCALVVMVFFPTALVLLSYQVYASSLS